MKNAFSGFHPAVNFTYFAVVMAFSMMLRHPVCLAISFISAAVYTAALYGARALSKKLYFIIPMMIFTALFNPLFNHQGVTVLMYFKNGNPLTLESIFYGLGAAAMMGCIILWALCFSAVMDTDRIICLFGRIVPSIALVITVTLRFIPAYIRRIKQVWDVRKCTLPDDNSRSGRLKSAFAVISSVTSWALESGVETADSMRYRGYGTGRRTSYSLYRWRRWDTMLTALIIAAAAALSALAAVGAARWQYYPTISGAENTAASIIFFAVYTLLGLLPTIIECKEAAKWRLLKSKI